MAGDRLKKARRIDLFEVKSLDLFWFVYFQTLLLHGNRLSVLHSCERYLPNGLTTLTLNDNQVRAHRYVIDLEGA